METGGKPRRQEALDWALAGAWALGIYLAVPLAREVQAAAEARGARMGFLWATLGAFALAGAWAVRAWRRREWTATAGQWAALAAVLGTFSVCAWSLRSNPEEAFHFVEYGVLGLLLFRALRHRLGDPSIYVAGALIGAAAGIGDELLQWLVPRRYFDYRDIAINAWAGTLAQAALWGGIRPAAARGRWSARGTRAACGALAAAAGLLLFCAANTPAFKESCARWIPYLATVEETTAEYGQRIDAGGGTIFHSRLAAEELRREDRDRGAEAGRRLGELPGDRDYSRFLREHPAHREPLAAEARIHAFRRDRYAAEARKQGAGALRRAAAEVAWRENEILEGWFGNTLAASGFGWSAERAAQVAAWRGAPKAGYESPVGGHLIVRVSRGQATGWLAALLIAALAGERWAARRAKA